MARRAPRGPPKGGHATRFQRGQSGNPSGRKKIPEDIKQAFQQLTPFAVNKLFELLDCKNLQVQLGAAREILDRNLGRAPQHTQITGANNGPVELIGRNMTAIDAARIYADSLGGEHASSTIAGELIDGREPEDPPS